MPPCNGAERGSASPHAQAGRLPSGVGGRQPAANQRREQSREVGEVARAFAGAAPATLVLSVAGTVVVTSGLTPRPMGQPRAEPRRVARCLSRMRGNLPVRF